MSKKVESKSAHETEKTQDESPDKLKELPEEHCIKLDEADTKLLERLKKHYGKEIEMVGAGALRNFITGYKHFEGKKDERFTETVKRIDALLAEYKKYDFNNILDKKLENESEMFKAWPLYCFGYDIQGHPVLYDEVASANIPAVMKWFGDGTSLKKLKTYRYRFHKRLANCKRIKSEKYNCLILRHCMVLDMQGFTASHLAGKFRGVCKDVIGTEQNLFPDTLHRCFVINAGWVFRTTWKILSNFVDPLTYKKIKVLGGQKHYLPEILKIISIDNIPKKYGGKSKLNIKLGYVADLPHDKYPLKQKQDANKKDNNNDDDNDKEKNGNNDDKKENTKD